MKMKTRDSVCNIVVFFEVNNQFRRCKINWILEMSQKKLKLINEVLPIIAIRRSNDIKSNEEYSLKQISGVSP